MESDDADRELARRLAADLAADERYRRQPLAVQVQNGVAILTGTVESPEVYDAVTARVRETPGVRDLCDGIIVQDGEARMREARQFGVLAARLAVQPMAGTAAAAPPRLWPAWPCSP